ncbi:MAG: c-type cytochrome [Deltaproteobacteria bacterium]|nr:c-type cytochrome [Deltaproteobacteria bacterium]
MRNTTLRRTSILVVGVLVCMAVGLGIVRHTVSSDTEGRDKGHHDHGDHDTQLPQAASRGASLFENKGCTQCHHTGSTQKKIGPGLKDLFERKSLPVSGRPVNEENVREQLKNPYKNMPSFADRLTDKERDQIIDYLKTL